MSAWMCVCRHHVTVRVLVALQDKAGQAQEATEQTVEQVSIELTWNRCSLCMHDVQHMQCRPTK